jgi:hypothetical protein
MKPNKCVRQTFFKPHNEKYGKVLNLFLASHPQGGEGWPDHEQFWMVARP